MNRIFIVVGQGIVQNVFSDKKNVDVEILDKDAHDEDTEKEIVKTEKKTKKMFEIY